MSENKDRTERFDQTQLHEDQHGKVVHRDYAAHFFRWGFATRFIGPESRVLDIGCGVETPLAKVLSFRNGQFPALYVGVDLNKIPKPFRAGWAEIYPEYNFVEHGDELLEDFTTVTCFEVVEHMRRPDAVELMRVAGRRLASGGRFLLSTPVHDGVHMPKNHIQEYTVAELAEMIGEAGLVVDKRYGTFANVVQLRKAATFSHLAIMAELREYYSDDILSTFLAPLYPDASRNNLWVLRRPE